MSPEPVQRDAPACSLCGEPAVIHQRHTARYLCGTHLIADIEQRVSDTITSEQQVVPGDCVAVALSGGKDSTALLLLLHRLFGSHNDIRLVAVTADEGISGYREETVRSAEDLVKRLGVEHITVSFGELFGDSLDTLLKGPGNAGLQHLRDPAEEGTGRGSGTGRGNETGNRPQPR